MSLSKMLNPRLLVGNGKPCRPGSDDNTASDQGLHCLLTECSNKFEQERKIPPNTPKLEMGSFF